MGLALAIVNDSVDGEDGEGSDFDVWQEKKSDGLSRKIKHAKQGCQNGGKKGSAEPEGKTT